MRQSSSVLLPLAFALCVAVSSVAAQPSLDGIQSYEAFAQAVTKYPYSASPERVARIKAGLSRVTRCMAKSTIQSLLGAPDYGDLNVGPKGPGERWLGSTWVYYISKHDRGVNENDVSLQIFFDTRDRAHRIVPAHIEGAKVTGALRETCA
jgi:hypothetical protein